MFCAFTRPRYHVSVYRTIGPLVVFSAKAKEINDTNNYCCTLLILIILKRGWRISMVFSDEFRSKLYIMLTCPYN